MVNLYIVESVQNHDHNGVVRIFVGLPEWLWAFKFVPSEARF